LQQSGISERKWCSESSDIEDAGNSSSADDVSSPRPANGIDGIAREHWREPAFTDAEFLEARREKGGNLVRGARRQPRDATLSLKSVNRAEREARAALGYVAARCCSDFSFPRSF